MTELAREHTKLAPSQIEHLRQLISEWGMLADLSFADLLLYAPLIDAGWGVLAQVRPATGQTIYPSDFVGLVGRDQLAPTLQATYDSGTANEATVFIGEVDDDVRVLAVPVVHEGATIAVLTKEWVERTGRRPGELERAYGECSERIVGMISRGAFPFSDRLGDSSSAPRVGDGALLLDRSGEVTYVSPNANSALHRVGIQASPVGMRLSELGFHDNTARQAYERKVPVIEEFEQGPEITLLARCVPSLDADGQVDGAILLMRDVTELRKRDRLLLSKDATIREIHHRVKNNLQTISSLLRLQSRRLDNPEAKRAVAESVRRIRTIALVHEALSREPGDDVTFLEIVRPLVRLAEEGLQSPDRPVEFRLKGDGGRIPSSIATPLSVVLTELLQNAVDHGYPVNAHGGVVLVSLEQVEDRLNISVADNGRGLDKGFELESATGLGLSIVRTLVTTELNGTISMRPVSDHDADRFSGELSGPTGTIVELSVPTAVD